ncbi:hypothetical protein SDC9_146052 [bioreactor metagenome]|uniref:Uncharacterized protein n=1 Tax=bioreactor metagenome TaxID=1076179 RepID=A0A645EE34_9ZZZZ
MEIMLESFKKCLLAKQHSSITRLKTGAAGAGHGLINQKERVVPFLRGKEMTKERVGLFNFERKNHF